jgi:hypothetical protein
LPLLRPIPQGFVAFYYFPVQIEPQSIRDKVLQYGQGEYLFLKQRNDPDKTNVKGSALDPLKKELLFSRPLSFRQKPESIRFKNLWAPAFAKQGQFRVVPHVANLQK